MKKRARKTPVEKEEPEGLKNTVPIRLYPTSAQARLLREHSQEYIACVNTIVSAYDADMIPQDFSTKDFSARLPSAVKNQVIRDAQSVFSRALELGRLPVLKKPIAQWNNQNWRIEDGMLVIPMWLGTKTQQVRIKCAGLPLVGEKGLLRIKKKRDKWIADVTMTLPPVEPVNSDLVMGVDTGVKVPAVAYISGKSARFFGNGRHMRYRRRRFYARRKKLQRFKKKKTLKQTERQERRWMKDVNHKISRSIVKFAHESGVGTIKLEQLSGIRERTTRTSRGAAARKNNRTQNSWTFYQLTEFLTYKAARLGIKVELVDPAHTSQECPACKHRNEAQDRTYECSECGWRGHRDVVGAINVSRRTGLAGQRQGAVGA